MKRIRGRRVALLLASAIQLLAEEEEIMPVPAANSDDDADVVVPNDDEKNNNDLLSFAKNNDLLSFAESGETPAQREQQQRQQDDDEDNLFSAAAAMPPFLQQLHDDDDDDWSELFLAGTEDEDDLHKICSVVPYRLPPFPESSIVNGTCSSSSSSGGRKKKRLQQNETAPAEHQEVKEEGEAVSDISVSKEQAAETTESEAIETTTLPSEDSIAVTTDKEEEESKTQAQVQVEKEVDYTSKVDYASKSAGALILEKSANFKDTSNLLTSNKDQYAITPCEEESKFVVIGLSEDILVKQVALANYELYSSHAKEFTVLGSTTMGNWIDLGTYTATAVNGQQTFDLKEPSWARYLTIRFNSHHDSEFYCTVSQISVHGSTMLQGFHEQWGDDDDDDEEKKAWNDNKDEEGSEPTSSGEPVDAADADDEDETVNPSSEHCSTILNAVCPNELSFERSMFLFRTENASEFDVLGALSSASICVASSDSAKSNKTLSRSLRELSQVAIVTPSSKARDSTSLIADASSDDRPSLLEDLTESPVAIKIQNLIKTTSGIEVSLEEIENGLSRSPRQDREDAVIKVTEPAPDSPEPETAKVEETKNGGESQANIDVQGDAVNHEASPPPQNDAQIDAKPASQPPVEEESAARDDIDEKSVALKTILQRLPSASCLEKLDFSDFKANILSSRNGGAAAAGGSGQRVPMEPVFQKLYDEIKALEKSVMIHDQFAKESIMCYQRIMFDLLVEMEALRMSHDVRIANLEKEIQSGTQWILALRRVLTPLIVGVASGLGFLYSFVLLDKESYVASWLRVLLASFLCFVVYHFLPSRSAGGRRQSTSDNGLPPEASPLGVCGQSNESSDTVEPIRRSVSTSSLNSNSPTLSRITISRRRSWSSIPSLS